MKEKKRKKINTFDLFERLKNNFTVDDIKRHNRERQKANNRGRTKVHNKIRNIMY